MILEVVIPNVAESISEVTLSRWMVKEGDYVKMDQSICEVETDKAAQELFAEKAGKITLIAKEGDDIKVGGLIAKIDTDAAAPAETVKAPAEEAPAKVEAKASEVKKEAPVSEKTSYASGTPSPAAAKIIAENNLNPAAISGSGPKGRITKADALQAIASGTATMQDAFKNLAAQSAAYSREERTEKTSRLRRTISERLVFAKNSTAMLTTFNEMDCSAMMNLRNTYGTVFKEKFGVISVL